jgi:hypothetical protein
MSNVTDDFFIHKFDWFPSDATKDIRRLRGFTQPPEPLQALQPDRALFMIVFDNPSLYFDIRMSLSPSGRTPRGILWALSDVSPTSKPVITLPTTNGWNDTNRYNNASALLVIPVGRSLAPPQIYSVRIDVTPVDSSAVIELGVSSDGVFGGNRAAIQPGGYQDTFAPSTLSSPIGLVPAVRGYEYVPDISLAANAPAGQDYLTLTSVSGVQVGDVIRPRYSYTVGIFGFPSQPQIDKYGIIGHRVMAINPSGLPSNSVRISPPVPTPVCDFFGNPNSASAVISLTRHYIGSSGFNGYPSGASISYY